MNDYSFMNGQIKHKGSAMVGRRDALMNLFSAKGVRVDTNKGHEYCDNLARLMQKRLDRLEKINIRRNK